MRPSRIVEQDEAVQSAGETDAVELSEDTILQHLEHWIVGFSRERSHCGCPVKGAPTPVWTVSVVSDQMSLDKYQRPKVRSLVDGHARSQRTQMHLKYRKYHGCGK